MPQIEPMKSDDPTHELLEELDMHKTVALNNILVDMMRALDDYRYRAAVRALAIRALDVIHDGGMSRTYSAERTTFEIGKYEVIETETENEDA